jgi:hypothetical protein
MNTNTDMSPAVLQVRSVPGGSISISKLGPDYLSTQGVCGTLQLQHQHQQQHQQELQSDLATPAAHAASTSGAAAPAGVYLGDAGGTTAAAAGAAAKVGGAAPCLFAYDGRWYLLVNRGTGW